MGSSTEFKTQNYVYKTTFPGRSSAFYFTAKEIYCLEVENHGLSWILETIDHLLSPIYSLDRHWEAPPSSKPKTMCMKTTFPGHTSRPTQCTPASRGNSPHRASGSVFAVYSCTGCHRTSNQFSPPEVVSGQGMGFHMSILVQRGQGNGF